MNRMRVAAEEGKVRWDAVVDCRRQAAPPAPAAARQGVQAGAATGQAALVKVWLYGTLGGAGVERPLQLELPGDASVASVIGALARRLGEDFAHQVLAADGSKFDHCLVFVDGVKVDSLDAPLGRGTGSLEMILLTVTEGG